MAAGGVSEQFCASSRAHGRECEYFADGGAATPTQSFDDMVDDSAQANPPQSFDAMVADPEPTPAPGVMFDDLKEDDPDNSGMSPADLQKKMFDRAYPNGPGPMESPGQQAGAIGEHLGRGVIGPAMPLIEHHVFGVPYEDMKAREDANPVESAAAEAVGMALPVSAVTKVAGALGKAGTAAADLAKFAAGYKELGTIGSRAISGMVEMGAMHGFDEISDAILGKGDPQNVVNPYLAWGANLFLGSMLKVAGGAVSDAAVKQVETRGMKAAADTEMYLAGIGHAVSGGELPKDAPKMFAKGYFKYDDLPADIAKKAIRTAGVLSGAAHGSSEGIAGAIKGAAEKWVETAIGGRIAEPIIKKIVDKPAQYVAPTVLRWMANGTQGSIYKLIDYADKVSKGTSLINNSVDALFKSTANQSLKMATPRNVEKLREWIDNGGIDQNVQQEIHDQSGGAVPGFAEGGEVKKPQPRTSLHDHDDHIAQNFPEQNVMIQAAKGRISSYLSAQRPQQHVAKLAFDDEPDQRDQKRSYDKALHVAVNPLGVLEHVKNGTVSPEHIQHLNAMYPDLTQHLQKKVTERIVKDQESGKKPSFVVRQGLSMLLGAPLSGEFTPQAIQAAQSVFANARSAQQQPQPQQKLKRGTAPLSKSSQAFLTDDQSRERRQQKA